MLQSALREWHRIAAERDAKGLDAILADDVVFQSPVVHTPQRGKAITTAYLTAALHVLNNEHFHYTGEWTAEDSAVLNFATVIDGIEIDGVDIITWNAEGRITNFKVMVRPLKAVNKLHEMMGAMLASMKPKG
jgi:ketosteroid isomerase-like protein